MITNGDVLQLPIIVLKILRKKKWILHKGARTLEFFDGRIGIFGPRFLQIKVEFFFIIAQLHADFERIDRRTWIQKWFEISLQYLM